MRKDGATAAWRCIAGFWLCALAAYFLTICYAFWTSYLALLRAIFLPGLAQIYWIWMTWKTTGVIFSLLTGLCIGCVAFGGLAVFLETKDPQYN
jgi:hypothetical protein